MDQLIFWIALFLLLYAFAGYPLLIWAWASFKRTNPTANSRHEPVVSILLSVYNEEEVIRDKIENFFQLNYPQDKIELIIVSDGCTDQTEDIIRSLKSERVRLFVQPKRGGKTLALNRGAREARGDILVFTDANSMFAPDAVHKLVRCFADPGIGLVSGRSVYLDPENRQEQSGGLYRRFEDFIKEQESATVSIIGADGAIYAMRRELYQPLPPEYINDFIHPMQVVAQGYRAVHEPGAVCTEVQEADTAGELSRQTRIMAQAWLIVFPQAKNLLTARRFAHLWAVLSHKVLRWLTLPLLAVLLVSNIWLVKYGWFFQLVLAAQIALYFLAALGWNKAQGLLKVPAMFILLHTAALLGLFRLATGQVYTTWNPRKN